MSDSSIREVRPGGTITLQALGFPAGQSPAVRLIALVGGAVAVGPTTSGVTEDSPGNYDVQLLIPQTLPEGDYAAEWQFSGVWYRDDDIVRVTSSPSISPTGGTTGAVSDSLRLVRFAGPHFEAAPPLVLRDLLAGETYIAEGGSPQLAPGEHHTGDIVLDHPYAGEVATLDRHSNSRLTVVLRVMGPDPLAMADGIVAACLAATGRCAIEWRRGGVGVPTYFPLRGDVDWSPAYAMRAYMGGAGMAITLGLEVAPFVHRGSMDVYDAFAPMADSGEVARNEVANPHGRDDLTGYTAPSGGVLSRVTDDTRGPCVAVTQTVADAHTYLYVGASTIACAPGEVVSLRGAVRPVSLTGSGRWDRLILRARFLNSANGQIELIKLDERVHPIPTTVQAITNPTFTLGIDGWQVSADCSIAWGPDGSGLPGTRSLELTTTGTNLSRVRTTDAESPVVAGGEVWSFACQAAYPAAANARTARLRIQTIDTLGAQVEFVTGPTTALPMDGSAATVTYNGVTIPAGAVQARVHVEYATVSGATSTGAVYQLDRVIAAKGTTAPSYFDGYSTNCRWYGAPHASQSEKYLTNPADFLNWHSLAGAATPAPAGTAYVQVVPWAINDSVATGHEWRARELMLTRTPAPVTYFDGDTEGAGWLGAPHASRSVLYARSPSADYALLYGTGIAVGGGALRPADATQKRIAHAGRGYLYADVQVTSEVVYGTTVANYEGPPAVKILDANNALWATNEANQLIIYKMDGGANAVLAAVTIVTPTAASRRWLRLRIEGTVVTAEWWTALPTPMGVPAQTVSATLAGADAAKFGAGVEGQAGIWFWVPHPSLTSYVDSLTVEPYTYRDLALPRRIALGGAVPGDIPALCDLQITHSGGAAVPVFGAVSPSPRPGTPAAGTVAPLGIIEAESATDRPNWTNETNTGARGGLRLHVATGDVGATNGGESFATALWRLDATTLGIESGESREIEVLARVGLSADLSGLSFVLSAQAHDGTPYGPVRYGDRGSAGLVPPLPSSGTRWRLVRLGRIALGGLDALSLNVFWPAVVSQVWLDYLVLLDAASMVSSPTGIADDASYPRLVTTTAQRTATLRHDGSALIAKPPSVAVSTHGLGGRLEVPTGNTDLVVALSSTVPGNPAANAADQQLAHQATVHPRLLPRFHLV